MITDKELLCSIQNRLPEIQQVIEMHEGFSAENKYIIKCENKNYLLRHSKDNNYQKKKEEFNLIEECYRKGVKCNKPIDVFKYNDFVYTLLEYIEGENGESVIPKIEQDKHFQIGRQAGIDLRKITSIKSKDNTWIERKWRKHQKYLNEYLESGYKFRDDNKIIEFINEEYRDIKHENDCLQHDDFHLGNIIINNEAYAGVIDFNRYDWGDPLHEFVKMEMFSYEFSKEFVRGQINGYFGTNKLNENIIKTIMVYVAMAIISTIVWTLKFYPNTMPHIEKINNRLIDKYRSFDLLRPIWAL